MQSVCCPLLSHKDLLSRRIDKFRMVRIQADLNRAFKWFNLFRWSPCNERSESHPQVNEDFMA